MELTTEQESAVSSPAGRSLLVSAAAGSGKTKVLVDRLLRKLEEKDAVSGEYNDIGDYLVITFTNAAAAELRNRIAAALNTRLKDSDCDEEERAHLRMQSRRLYYAAHISTIDSFCIDLLRQYAWLFDLNADFRICDNEEENEIAGGILNKLLEQKYAETLTEMNKKKKAGVDQNEEPPWEDYREGYSGFFKLADLALDKTYGSRLEEMVLYIHKKLEICDDPERWIREHQLDFRSANGKKQKKNDAEAERFLQDATKELQNLVSEFDKLLLAEKMRIGALTFTDVERLAVRLLKGETNPDWSDAHKAAVRQVRESLRNQFKEIMIDEYQDTNRLQDSLFEALSDSGENFFLVGDVKQSIYRFRNADPTIFLEKYCSWVPPEDAAEGQGIRMTLSRNFRSRPQILSAVNEVFSVLMSRDCGEVDFRNEGQFAFDPGAETDGKFDVEMDVLVRSSEEKNQQEDNQQEKELPDSRLMEARLVARRIKEMVRQDGRPQEKSQLYVEEKDIAILIPFLRPVQKYYVQALSEAGIRVELEEEVRFNEFIYNNTEISVAVSLLQLIDNPRRDIPLLSVLNSPIFSFTPERLTEIRALHQDCCFYEAMIQNTGSDCAGFIREIDRFRTCFHDMPVHILLENLYRETHMREIFGSMQNGKTRLENLDALSDKARNLENTGISGLSAFLRRIDSALNNEKTDDYVTVSHGSGGVKLMTIHRAKGLEFPVVFLCALDQNFNNSDEKEPMLFHIREGLGAKFLQSGDGWRARWESPPFERVKQAIHSDTLSENMRLLYVGMTRARDKLIMTMEIDEEKLSELRKDIKSDIDAGKVAGKNCMAEWLLLATLSRPETGVLTADEPDTANGRGWVFNRWVYDSKNEHEQPRESENSLDEKTHDGGLHSYSYADIALRPARLSPSQLDGQYEISGNHITETDATGTCIPGSAGTDSFPFPESLDRKSDLSPREKGTATHKVMQYIDLEQTGSVENIKNEIVRLEKEKYITQEEAESAAPETVFRFFSSQIGKQLLRASERHREYSFSFLLPWEEDNRQDETLIQGIIDCWFISNTGEITVLDFKTDQIPNPGRYTEQIKSYTLALESTLNRKVSHSILYFFSNNQAYSPKNMETDKWDWQPIAER